MPSAVVKTISQVPVPSSAEVRARDSTTVLMWKYSDLRMAGKRMLPRKRSPSEVTIRRRVTTVPRRARFVR